MLIADIVGIIRKYDNSFESWFQLLINDLFLEVKPVTCDHSSWPISPVTVARGLSTRRNAWRMTHGCEVCGVKWRMNEWRLFAYVLRGSNRVRRCSFWRDVKHVVHASWLAALLVSMSAGGGLETRRWLPIKLKTVKLSAFCSQHCSVISTSETMRKLTYMKGFVHKQRNST